MELRGRAAASCGRDTRVQSYKWKGGPDFWEGFQHSSGFHWSLPIRVRASRPRMLLKRVTCMTLSKFEWSTGMSATLGLLVLARVRSRQAPIGCLRWRRPRWGWAHAAKAGCHSKPGAFTRRQAGATRPEVQPTAPPWCLPGLQTIRAGCGWPSSPRTSTVSFTGG